MCSIAMMLRELDNQSMTDVQTFCRTARGAIDAYEARRLAAAMDDPADTRAAARTAGAGGGRTKREAAKAAKRAAAVKRNSKLADDLESGRLSTDQADAIADAAAKSDGEAACDDALIDAVAAVDADQAKRLTDDWLEKRANEQDLADTHARQRRKRRASSYYDRNNDLHAIKLQGDQASIAELWAAIEQRERRLWDNDGGRDISPTKHARSRDQRLFDAAVEILAGTGAARSSAKPAVVFSIAADRPASMVGEGPVPDDVIRDVLARSNLFVNLTDLSGQTMWFGRLRRNASTSQWIALVIRDRGCVLCGEHWSKCHAHHRIPWNSPAAGETNIDQLVLHCESCHHTVHDTNQTTIQRPDGSWTTRPAHTHELAPKRPKSAASARRRQGAPTTPARETVRPIRGDNKSTHRQRRNQRSTNDRDDEAA